MGEKRDYTRYSKETVGTIKPVEVAETVVDDTQTEVTTVEVEHETKVEDVMVKEPEPIIGIVTNCNKLNVREHPNTTAAILGIISASTELVIIEEESTKDFYKICTSAGLEGYCMKKFITVMS